MSFEGMDDSLLQDFLTESAELIEQLDADLVALEEAEGEAQADLLNSVFRALHTIKGASSFLGIQEIITLAHAAEDALNKLRKGEATVTPEVMDALLRAVDVLREQLSQLGEGAALVQAPEDLVAQLRAITEGKVGAVAATITAGDDKGENAAKTAEDADGGHQSGRALDLPPQKKDLLEFIIADLVEQTEQIDQCIAQARQAAMKCDAASLLAEVTGGLTRTLDFFELDALKELSQAFEALAGHLADLPDGLLEESLVRVKAFKQLLEEQAGSLQHGRVLDWSLDTMTARVTTLAGGETLEDGVANTHGGDVKRAMQIDKVALIEAPSTPGTEPAVEETTESTVSVAAPPELALVGTDEEAPGPGDAPREPVPAPAEANASGAPADQARSAAKSQPSKATPVEHTIRVEVGRLEDLLNLVGQMVLTKNRLVSLGRKVRGFDVPQEFAEEVTTANGDLDRLTGELQVSVMRTRMQPLAKLFDRYPRVIRDMARMTDKKIHLEIEGKETEVDKSVLELLADPLVHILRNSADHGIERPADRLAAGKNELGTIRLVAEHQGSHVRVAIFDDGKGLDREVIGNKAVEKGLTTPDKLAGMADNDVFRFIFAPGFSTADQVSDLSGRGVGMDVVNSNVTKMNGQINVNSKKGEGTTIEILIPLTVAIMPAMMVGIGQNLYAVPLQSIVEIVRPEASNCYTVSGFPVMRLRDSVLPLVGMRQVLEETGEGESRFAVVVGVGGQRAGLMVDELIGQQEIVIKPLDDEATRGGPFSGATIREDGEVSLILDVIQLIRSSQMDVQAQSTEQKIAA